MMEDIEFYLNENLEGMVESHLMVWFWSEYHGKLKEDVIAHMKTHDDSLEIESAEEELKRELLIEEESFLIKEFKEGVVDCIEFVNSVAIGFWNTLDELETCGKGVA